MKANLRKSGFCVGLLVAAWTLSFSALGQVHGGGGSHAGGTHAGAAHEGAAGRPGGGWHGGGGWRGGGPVWWGWGLGVGLGWEATYLFDPYLYAPYPGYYFPYGPPAVVTPAAPAPVAPPAPAAYPAATSFWYYCDAARGYYPYVSQCPEQWRAVPSVPPGAAR